MNIEDLFRPIDPSFRFRPTVGEQEPPQGGGGAPPPQASADGNPPPDPAIVPPPAGDVPPQETVEQKVARLEREIAWRDKQIDRGHRIKKDADRELEAARSESQRLRELAEAAVQRREPPPGDPPPVAARPPVVAPQQQPASKSEQQIREEAMTAARVELLESEMSRNYSEDWPVAVENFKRQGGLDAGVMAAVLGTDDPAYVLVQLGKNPQLYQEMLDKPSNIRQRDLVKMAMAKPGVAAPVIRKPSEAPPPPGSLPPGGGGPAMPTGNVDLYDPRMQMAGPPTREGLAMPVNPRADEYDEAWFAARRQQKLESTGRPWSVKRR